MADTQAPVPASAPPPPPPPHTTLQAVEPHPHPHPPLNLIPVGLKEAALDSPTFRATALHFADNIDSVERWLDGYVKAASRLLSELASLEAAVNSFLTHSTPPAHISEAVLDHDYTLLAMRRYGEGARDFWQATLRSTKRSDPVVIDPIKSWLNSDLRSFKNARRDMENAQKAFDSVITRYLGQSKAKEASSLREDAFQLHEARKLYLRSSMDFCVQAPQVRASLDKLLVKVFADQWKEMRQARDSSAATLAKWSSDIDRVRGWSREMENSERAFKRELLTARKQIEESAEAKMRPSRELEDYAASTVPYLGTGASSATGANKSKDGKAEKQGWLLLKTITGKPARTVWSRRWFFVKHGIFGWLVQGTRSGGVEESERTGVLLCSVRPAFQEERRFCFEVKTKSQSIILQAETQQELTQWISAFEVAKRKALEHPASTETSPSAPGVDPAFAISPPVAPEFAAKVGEGGHISTGSEEIGLVPPEREATGLGLVTRASPDVNPARRVMSLNVDSEPNLREGPRDHAARIISKLDLHKRPPASPPLTSSPAPAGGIASLISASHNILPVGPGTPGPATDAPKRQLPMPTSTLAPSTLANPPAPTNLSHTAVVVSGERGIGLARSDGSGMPSGILANLWGSSNWGYVNRLGDAPPPPPKWPSSQPSSPPLRALRALSVSQDDSIIMDGMDEPPKLSLNPLSPDIAPSAAHKKNQSIGTELPAAVLTSVKEEPTATEDYPAFYPLPLKAQDAQFRMLFPTVAKDEKVVLVFRATWNPNEQQEFPGRVYVTAREIYFFSNHLGLVLITSVSLASLSEVTAAPGRDCDFLYLHLKENILRPDDARRVTVKLFLEPLKLLQRRLNYLAHNADKEQPAGLEEIIKALIRMETEEPRRSSSVESWEDVAYETDGAAADQTTPQRRRERNIKASLRIDGNLYGETPKTGREIQKFKLPAQPVVYAPQGMQESITREFTVSAKALFHVMFGDKSAVFQLLYCNRWADTIVQTPWTKPEKGHWTRKFASQNHKTPLADSQTIDIFNDHLCYVVTNHKYPWRLPYSDSFSLTTKFVITHTAKSRSKLAVFQKLSWHKAPPISYLKDLIERQAYNTLEADALDLSNVAMDQVAKLGTHSKTNKAVEIFGSIGQQTQAAQMDSSQVPDGAVPPMSVVPTRPVSVFRLVSSDLAVRAIGALSVVFDAIVAIGKGAINLCTAHTLLVIVFIISALYNSWHGYRDGLVWYHDKKAARYMARLGVTPEPMMAKAVYLSDLEELVAPKAGNDSMSALITSTVDRRRKTCRSTFSEQLTTSISTAVSQNPTSARLRRSRDSLARYRHDLMVALRVVNRVERDVILAEWEDWVRSEDKKCQKINEMMRHVKEKSGKDSKKQDQAEVERELGEDFADYCKSCRTEVSELESGSRLI
ncbi:transcription factor SipA3 [Pseudocercospora fijiensis CIRAD86]|uniref:Transcription factor SipA3 n=1 Tax=Pseudocercospora fijiensis (strain CIRAD86) TaxID=383855 RepID=N1QA43_PSEFD|nr:transcription factor SipA3 [Pseudocercospora fijiensis CIRAD86]EME89795.1 transcription factor SipA3 [Pseudocercospora fijiensis CIRAD86]